MIDNGVPTTEDIEFADTYLVDDEGNCSCKKTARETARHRRLIGGIHHSLRKLERGMYGDPDNSQPGVQQMVTEMWEKDTGKKATDRIESHIPVAVEEKEDDKVFIISLRAILKFLKWFIATLLTVGGLIMAIVSYLS